MVKIEIVGVFLAVILFLLISNLSDPNVRSATVYGSLFGLMALGLTLTYITTKVLNFAYGSFVTIGMYTSYAMYRLWYKFIGYTITPYLSAPISFLIGALVPVTIYLALF